MTTAVRFRLVLGVALCLLLVSGFVWGRRVFQDLLLERLAAGMRDLLVLVERLVPDPGRVPDPARVPDPGRVSDPRAGVAGRLPDLSGVVAGLDGVRLSIIDEAGFVIADSLIGNTGILENHRDRSEVVQARSSGWGLAVRDSASLGYRMMYVALSRNGYVLRLARDLRSVDEMLAAGERLAMGAGLLLVAVFLAVSTVLARIIVRPLAALSSQAVRWGEGEYGGRISLSGTDEIVTLAAAFNTMAGRVEGLVASLRAEKHRLESTLATMTEAIAVLDGEGRLVLWNDAFAAGFSPARLGNGLPYYEALDSADLVRAVDAVIRGGQPVRLEAELPRRHETRVEAQLLPLGQSEGVLLVLRDITEQYAYQRMKAEFAANASHELKTPLAIMDGYVQTLLQDPPPDEETRLRFTRRMAANIARLRELVADIILLNRLEEGGHRPELEQVDLVRIIERVTSAIQPAAEAAGVRIVPAISLRRAVMAGNASLLESLVFNLVDNAVRYSSSGGRVHLGLEMLYEGFELRVRDHGCGFMPGEERRIFERFYRGETSRSRDTGGSGLGLAIAKYIARFHGGTISAESPGPGEGAEFVVVLPFSALPQE